ncbi:MULTISPECIES: hypothetical protein [Chloroflexus]|jgi:hypothetical protein|nr:MULTISPECIES: hypothetical protein [Chloroflexus]GIV93628.1 MAG: hypothetical protein KatS3mg056_2337 [Chloroflexus sp.]
MTQPEPNQNPLPQVPARTAPPPTQSRSCLSRLIGFIGWLFTIAIAVGLALVVAGGILYWAGVDLTTPQQIREANEGVQTLQALTTSQAESIGQLQTAQAQTLSDLNGARERIDELEVQADALATAATAQVGQAATAVALGRALQTAVAEAVVLQDQLAEERVLVAVVATVQAQQNERIREVELRSERLIRFLNRLSDIAGDTAEDVTTPTPLATPPAVSPTPTSTVQVTPTP